MRAIRLRTPGGLDKLEPAELPEPSSPGPGEIQVRIRASSLNYHDYVVVSGAAKFTDGLVPMSDGAGEVSAVGEGVNEFKPGDLVVSTFFTEWLQGDPREGGFAKTPGDGIDGYARERVTAPATHFTHAPRGYSAAEAATLTTAGLTAWRALVVEGGLKAGDVVLVQGSGGVSVFALQLAKAMGAVVIATSSSDEKLTRLRTLGADHLINYKREPKWGAAAKAWTGGRGVDHVVEIGGPGTMGQSIAALCSGGHIALLGILTGLQGTIPTALLMQKQIRVTGITVGSRVQQQQMIRAIEATRIKPVIDIHFTLEELAEAFRYQAAGKHFGKISLEI
jgi:NADPH:quinone reductase-like Zn-dependent oxidoreductase